MSLPLIPARLPLSFDQLVEGRGLRGGCFERTVIRAASRRVAAERQGSPSLGALDRESAVGDATEIRDLIAAATEGASEGAATLREAGVSLQLEDYEVSVSYETERPVTAEVRLMFTPQ